MLAYRKLVKRSVIINTKDEQSFRGILMANRGPLLILVNAELLELGNNPVDIAGEVVIERKNVQFIQVLPNGKMG